MTKKVRNGVIRLRVEVPDCRASVKTAMSRRDVLPAPVGTLTATGQPLSETSAASRVCHLKGSLPALTAAKNLGKSDAVTFGPPKGA